VGKGVIETLVNKTDKVLPSKDPWQLHYIFFACHGFTQPAQDHAAEANAMLVTRYPVPVGSRYAPLIDSETSYLICHYIYEGMRIY